jgi:acetyl-CoA C-acetyltransferase
VALRERNRLDTAAVDDVVMGCVVPVGAQGGNVGRMAVLQADYAQSVAGVQLNRYCGSGLEAVSFAAAKVMAGQADMTIGAGGDDVPRAHGLGRWCLGAGPAAGQQDLFRDAGHFGRSAGMLRGHSRRDLDAYRPKAIAARPRPGPKGALTSRSCPSRIFCMTLLEKDETIRAETSLIAGRLKPAFTDGPEIRL